MKSIYLILLVLFYLSVSALAQTKTIMNPAYEFKNSGIYNVTKIELSDTATLLTINNTFIPHWWVQFNNTESIRDCATGTEYNLIDVKGAVLGQKLWMPDSGDSTVVLIFPPLPASVNKIDYSEGIFGISLNGKHAGKRKPSTVSPEIEKWMKTELAKAPKNVLPNFNTPEFFTDAPARLIGCIKGYDKRIDFSTGIVYASNEFTRDELPVVVQIHPDGRFEADIPMNNPKCNYLIFSDQYLFPFYIEPGQTLSIILDWDEFLIADRKRNIRYQFEQIEFRGPLAKLNTEIFNYKFKEQDWAEFDKLRKTMPPVDFKELQKKALDNDLAQYAEYLRNNKISIKAQALLHNTILLKNAGLLFDYGLSRDYYAKQDTSNQVLKMPIPIEYYDFLKKIDLNNQGLLAVYDFGSFINRFEYCDPFSNARQNAYKNRVQAKPKKTMSDYFIEEKIELTDKENQFLSLAGKGQLSNEDLAALKQMEETSKAFNEKYKDQIQKYVDKYITPLNSQLNNLTEIDIWKAKDSVLTNALGLEHTLAYEITKIRSLKFSFKYMGEKDKAAELWGFIKQGITNPYLIATGQHLLNRAYPEVQNAATPLPEGIATDIFRKIIDPFKGKVLFVDFWATTCGPCVSGIRSMKEIREKYANNPDFDFIFITDERSSPENTYNDLVKEQGLKNVFRLPKDDFNYLRQLFRFNGIPHYVAIDQKGNVINDDFSMWSFEAELKKILPAYNK